MVNINFSAYLPVSLYFCAVHVLSEISRRELLVLTVFYSEYFALLPI
jgi:hypothetical protein